MPDHDEIITIIDEDGNEHDVVIYDILEVEDERYAIVVPVIEEGEEEGEEDDGAFVLKIEQDEEGSDILVEISEEEWDRIKEACMEEYEFDEEDQ